MAARRSSRSPPKTKRRSKVSPDRKLCERGYKAAKAKFDVYPSAYANAYAAQVCRGKRPDAEGKTFADKAYMKRLERRKKSDKGSDLQRWFKEQWVNVCEWPEGDYDFPPPFPNCGRKKGTLKPKDYPYCRPLKRIDKATPKTVKELGPAKLKKMCTKKRKKMKQHGKRKSPSRVYVD